MKSLEDRGDFYFNVTELAGRPLAKRVGLAEIIDADIGRDEPGTLVLLDELHLTQHPDHGELARLAALQRTKVALLARPKAEVVGWSESDAAREDARVREVLARHPKLAAAPAYAIAGLFQEAVLLVAAAEAAADPGLRRVVALLEKVDYYPCYYTNVHYELARLGLTFTPYNLPL